MGRIYGSEPVTAYESLEGEPTHELVAASALFLRNDSDLEPEQ